MKKMLLCAVAAMIVWGADAQTGRELSFQKWALTPPMGWNSWDCYGPTVVEDEVKANADYMAAKLLDYGWEYVIVDIRWFVENDKAGGYNQTNPVYVYDGYGRYTPALNRFPSAANGVGFKALADYVHDKGLKFGIHLMRGLPKIAAEKKLPVKGTDGITCDMIASNDSACTWLRDNYKVDYTKPGAQEYYNSCFELYASWGVDYVKIDDLSRPYHTAEIEMIRKAIDACGRPIVLSLSPGETPIEKMEHVKTHANMWRTVDDFWDNWSQLNYQFQVCAKWAPYIAPGTWPDADMLPLGKISIRGERGAERWTNFTRDEQYTMMNLWTIFKSPLMYGGDLPQNDKATDSLLTNRDVIYMHHYSANNRQLSREDNRIVWTADDPANGDKFVALFNTGGSTFVNTANALYRSGTISYLTTGYATDVEVNIPEGSRQLALVATDGGDGYDCDHADWINPVVTLKDGSTVDLTTKQYLRGTCGWGSIHVNRNMEGGTLSIDGNTFSKGFAVHANSILLFALPEDAVKFTAHVGIDNTGSDQGSKSSVEFLVFNEDPTLREETTDRWNGGNVTMKVDPGKQVACSDYICRTGTAQQELEADITGAGKLYLVVTNGGDGLSYDHADWVNPVLVSGDGTETSLTTIAWDADPVNGWNAPRLNKNNDGGTLKLGGVSYDKGFGVNAPSRLVFTLPEGHDYRTLKVLVGYDSGVQNASEGVTMEFRIFTEDPSPDNEAPVSLDLIRLGFAADQPCRITEMWKGKEEGVFRNTEFAPVLREHASGLYRVAAVERAAGASVSIAVEGGEHTSADTFNIGMTVSGGEAEGAYVQLLCDGKIIGTLPVEADGTATYVCSGLYGGEHTLQALYSGTPSVASAASDEVIVTVQGAAEDLTLLRKRLQNLIDEAEKIDRTLVVGASRAVLAEALEKARPVENKTKAELEEAIAGLQDALDAARRTMSVMARLRTAIDEAAVFLEAISESPARNSLVAVIQECESVYVGAGSTKEDVEAACEKLKNRMSETKKTAQPLPGARFDMTEFLVNPSFELQTTGWKTANKVSGWESFATWSDRPAADGSSFISLCYQNITSIDLYQLVDGLPAGIYEVEASLRNTDGISFVKDQHVYAQVGTTEYSSAFLSNVSGTDNNDWYRFTVDRIQLGDGETLRLGVRSSGNGSGTVGWFQADDFRLYYLGRALENAIRAIACEREGVTVTPCAGGVRVSSSVPCVLPLYTVGGSQVGTLEIRTGVQDVHLVHGQYILNGKIVIVK